MMVKKISGVLAFLVAFMFAAPSFAVTAVVDAERILSEYTKAKNAAIQFQAQEKTFQNEVIDAQKKVKQATSPVEQKNLVETYDKKLKEQAAKMQKEQVTKLKEINDDVMKAINKVNGGKYDLILKKSATVYCKRDITDDVLKVLNGVK